MDISYLGSGSLKLSGKSLNIVFDAEGKVTAGEMIIDGPGEYEIKGAMITGVPVGEQTAYSIEIDGINVCAIGQIETLENKQIEALGQIDVLAIDPVSSTAAAKIVTQVEPKYVIPATDQPAEFIKEIGASPEPVIKLRLNAKEMPTETTVVVLQKI